MPRSLSRQAELLYDALSPLIRNVQFRDREAVCCHGVSVTQCYLLRDLQERGAMAMGELAREQRMEMSTMTRAVDGLVAKKLVTRTTDRADRRSKRIRITAKGRTILERIGDEGRAEMKDVLRRLHVSSREDVVVAVGLLAEAVRPREECCSSNGTKEEA